MATTIIKRDGTEEPFDAEKLKQSIRINAIDSTLAEAAGKIKELVEGVSSKVMQEIEGTEKIKADEIKEKVLKELDETAPKVSEIWRKFDQEAKT